MWKVSLYLALIVSHIFPEPSRVLCGSQSPLWPHALSPTPSSGFLFHSCVKTPCILPRHSHLLPAERSPPLGHFSDPMSSLVLVPSPETFSTYDSPTYIVQTLPFFRMCIQTLAISARQQSQMVLSKQSVSVSWGSVLICLGTLVTLYFVFYL